MARKPRSQRRNNKGGVSNNGDESSKSNKNKKDKLSISYDPGFNNNNDQLSETYTVADSFSIASTLVEDDFNEKILDEDIEDNINNDKDNVTTAASKRHQKLLDILNILTDYTSEKRTVKREGIMRKLFRSITHYATGTIGYETIEHHFESHIQPCCLFSLRQYNCPAEQYVACRVFEASSVLLGCDQDIVYESILYKPLSRIIMSTNASRSIAVRIAALRALTMCNFICCSNDDITSTNELLNLCQLLAQETYREEPSPLSIRTAAIDCWSLLATKISYGALSGQYDNDIVGRGLLFLTTIQTSLDTSNVLLRSSAGECMSLIHEARLNLGTDDNFDNTDNDNNCTERKYRQGSWENSGEEYEILIDEIRQRVGELSNESGYQLSKKAKKEQKSSFREYMGTIIDNESPTEIINFRNIGSITLDSWESIIQLNFIRHCLQGGFQIQLLTNTTLQDIFNVDNNIISKAFNGNNNNLSSMEKRWFLSKNSEVSKENDMKLTKQRRNRNNVKNHFLTIDGDDI